MDRRSKIKIGIYFGLPMAMLYILSHLLVEGNWSLRNMGFTVISGLTGGLVAGILFGWGMGAFANSKRVAQSTEITPEKDETMLFGAQASHLKGLESIGGKLYLTDKRLVFKSHAYNFRNETFSIALQEIVSLHAFKSLGLISNGMAITLSDQKKVKFIVERPEDWISRLSGNNGKEVMQEA